MGSIGTTAGEAAAVHVGLLGAGNISDTHARASVAIPGVRIAAVHGANAEKAVRLAQAHGATSYTSLEHFLAHHPLHLVAIGSPSGCHADEVIAAARAGLHVLCEKPLGISTAEVDRMIEECERAGVRLAVFFQDRCQPDFVRLKAFLAAGGLGRIHLATARVKWYRPPEYYAGSRWRGVRRLDGGGAVMNQGIHTLDLLLWLLGDVARVSAATRTAAHAIEVEDTAVATLQFSSGVLGTYEATTVAFPGYPRRVEISGDQGTIVIENDRVVAADLRPGAPAFAISAPSGSAESAASPIVSDASPHRRVIEDFLEAIRAGRRPVCDGPEGRRSVELVQALYASAQSGAGVDLASRG
jgi:UDP-N-acetyl-2-amino-2-deoxyglucuronate dehydrogenase